MNGQESQPRKLPIIPIYGQIVRTMDEICECGHSRFAHKDKFFGLRRGTGRCCVETMILKRCGCSKFTLSYRVINDAKDYV